MAVKHVELAERIQELVFDTAEGWRFVERIEKELGCDIESAGLIVTGIPGRDSARFIVLELGMVNGDAVVKPNDNS